LVLADIVADSQVLSKAKAAYGALQATNLTNPLVGPLKVTRACGRRAPFLAAAGGCYAATAVSPAGVLDVGSPL
jgi:hypothetical protein